MSTPHPLFTPAENLTVARIALRAAKYELRLLKQAEKAGRIPTAKTVVRRSFARSFARAFADR